MTVENISWSISTKECCRPRRGLNPRPPGLQSDGASNWATEASWFCSRNNGICDCKSDDLLPQITNFQYSYPHSNAFIHLFCLKKCFVKKKSYLHKAASHVSCVKTKRQPMKVTLRDDIWFPTVYCRKYCRKFLTLSNETSRYICKCIRMSFHKWLEAKMTLWPTQILDW